MGDTSLDTNESSLSTSQATTEPSDDEDDELLALRIAALESIKIKESKAAAKSRQKFETEAPARKPEFLIKSHTSRSNLLSIVTCEDEIEKTITPAPTVSRISPPPLPAFDASRPPPGFPRTSPPPPRTSPPPSQKFSRSPPRRFSRSPRRWSSRSPQPRRRSPLSPYRPRRRSYSKSPPRRSSKSPLPRRRSRSPVLSSRLAPPRSPPPRRSPSPNRRLGVPPSPTTPDTEWETDTEGEEEVGEVVKLVAEKPAAEEPIVKPKVEHEELDASVDDVLKLDATAEVDEFSAFLNEFEDEVLTEKKIKANKETVIVKNERPATEKKVVDGKRFRKKVKPVKETAPRQRSRSMTRRRRSHSPRGRGPGWRRSPGRRYFSPGRGGRRGSFSPDKFGKSPMKGSPSRKPRSSNTPERMGGLLKGKERSSKGRDSKPREKARVSSEEKRSREEEEYKERLSKLPTPEREVMEARRKKFLKGVGVDGTKKISLKSTKAEIKSSKVENKPYPVMEPKAAFERLKKVSMTEDDDELNADIGDTLDMFDDEISPNKSSAKENSPPQVMKNVTDLRVQLHKKRRAQETREGVQVDQGGKNPLLRSVSPSESRDPPPDGLEPDDFGPVTAHLRRKVVPPGKQPVSSNLKMPGSQDSDRSPSPPPAKKMRKRRRADTEGDEEIGLGGRRILVVKKDDSRESSPDMNITTAASPRKAMKKSLHQRLGEKILANQFSEEEIYNEMLRQQEKKKAQAEKKELKKFKREMKKKEKMEKKKKKSKKDKKVDHESDALSEDDFKALADVPAEDSDEELYRFFENKSPEDEKGRKRKVSARRSSGEKSSSKGRRSSSRGRRSSGELSGGEKGGRGSFKERLGKKLDQPKKKKLALEDLQLDLEKLQGSTDEESLDLLQKMKRKNEKRLRRMREIERDKILFA